MNAITRVTLVVIAAVAAVARPAAAQEPEWVRELTLAVQEHAAEALRYAAAQIERPQGGGPPDGRRGRPPVDPRTGRPIPPGPGDERRRGPRGPEPTGPEYTERVTRSVRIGRAGSVEIQNVSGTVSITGGGGDEVRVEALKRVRHPDETEGRRLLQEIEIRVTERTGFADIRTEVPRGRGNRNNGAVDYTVAVPVGANVSVKTVSGDVRVTNVRGELRAEVISGNVTASTVARLRAVKTVSGDIHLTDVQGDDVVLGTVSGNMSLRNLKVRGLEAEAVSGGIGIIDADCERLEVGTTNGNLTFTGRLTRGGRYELQTHSGNIEITPLGPTGFDLEATSFSGAVRSGYTFPGERAGATSLTDGRRGPRMGTSLRGAFGDGSAILSLRSFSGDVTIHKK